MPSKNPNLLGPIGPSSNYSVDTAIVKTTTLPICIGKQIDYSSALCSLTPFWHFGGQTTNSLLRSGRPLVYFSLTFRVQSDLTLRICNGDGIVCSSAGKMTKLPLCINEQMNCASGA